MKNEMKKSMTEDLRVISDIIESAGICMLTTHNHAGGLCSRPMYTQEADENGNLWFFTSSNSHLVSEIRSNHQVQLTYASGKEKFVSASGNAYEVFDRARMIKLWTPMMKAWFPQGIETADLVLLRVELQDVEYWETPSSPVIKVAGFFKSMVSDKPYTPGHHEKVNLHH
ncbi:pyridoxamine 5'-phosphate oxidase family protein [Pseudobdellovibrio sp. HCB154]|uniref:pyridoxamine 5'-phosphate oxidase family protein n=1 Tax=Pseudobdellovibrio sp. HCB154 TaxID=3386277 RepID=UPI0039172E54